MKVRCIAHEPNEEQRQMLGSTFVPGRTVYPVERGRVYTVYGIGIWEGVTWVEIAMQNEVVVSVPLLLFEITDARPSRCWEIRLHPDGALTLLPAVFYDKNFHSRLADGALDAVEEFRRLRRTLEQEE